MNTIKFKEDSIFVGIDPSLTATAIVSIDSSGKLIHSRVCGIELRGPSRLAGIRDLVRNELGAYSTSIELVCIEHYAMGAKFGRESAGEIGGVLRVMLWESGFEYFEIPPLRLKQFATGKSQAEKDHILMAIYKKWGLEFNTNDEADAFVLAQMARAIYEMQTYGKSDLSWFEREVIENILHPVKKAKGKKLKE